MSVAEELCRRLSANKEHMDTLLEHLAGLEKELENRCDLFEPAMAFKFDTEDNLYAQIGRLAMLTRNTEAELRKLKKQMALHTKELQGYNS